MTFPLTADVAALTGETKDAAVLQQADAVRTQVATAMSTELDRIWPEAQRTTTRAGLALQLRQATVGLTDLAVQADGRYAMTVAAEFAGVNDVQHKLTLTTENGATFLPVPVDVATVRRPCTSASPRSSAA